MVKSEWYNNLKKSSLNPPDYTFSIVWPILYIMIFTSFIYYIRLKPDWIGIIIFIIQIGLNLSWSPVFFESQSPGYALIILIIMWLSILINIIYVYKTAPTSSYLLIPYFIWVTFASYLNYFIAVNN